MDTTPSRRTDISARAAQSKTAYRVILDRAAVEVFEHHARHFVPRNAERRRSRLRERARYRTTADRAVVMRDNAAHLAAHCGILRTDDRNARHRTVIHVRDGRNRRVERVFVVLNAVVNFRAVKSDVRNDGAALQKLEQRPEPAVIIDSDIGQLFAVSVERAVERLAHV